MSVRQQVTAGVEAEPSLEGELAEGSVARGEITDYGAGLSAEKRH